jgi:hypothetical protein
MKSTDINRLETPIEIRSVEFDDGELYVTTATERAADDVMMITGVPLLAQELSPDIAAR